MNGKNLVWEHIWVLVKRLIQLFKLILAEASGSGWIDSNPSEMWFIYFTLKRLLRCLFKEIVMVAFLLMVIYSTFFLSVRRDSFTFLIKKSPCSLSSFSGIEKTYEELGSTALLLDNKGDFSLFSDQSKYVNINLNFFRECYFITLHIQQAVSWSFRKIFSM